jgi:hypothetical protein
MRFVLVGPQRRQRLQPIRRHSAVIILVFLAFGGLANPALHLLIGDCHKRPRLLVSAAGRGPGGADGQLDRFAGHRFCGEMARRPPP